MQGKQAVGEAPAWPLAGDETVSESAAQSSADIVILAPPPPSYHGFATYFRPDGATQARARSALVEARQVYAYLDPPGIYPFRMVETRQTGLPGYLTWLFNAKDGDATQLQVDLGTAAKRWLAQASLGTAIFGRDPRDLPQGDIRYMNAISLSPYGKDGRKAPAVVHTAFRQWYEQWPVYGGRIVASIMLQGRPASVTSSYYPILDSSEEKLQFSKDLIERDEAIDRARQALQYAHAKLGGERQGLFRSSNGDWNAGVVPYAGSDIFIYPFVGSYYLAYQVEFVDYAGDHGWRVIVDARRDPCLVLGWPEDLTAGALTAFSTAGGVGGTPQPVSQADLASGFCTIRWHADRGGGFIDWPAIAGKQTPLTSLEQEAVNVSANAKRIMDRFVALGSGTNLTNFLENTADHIPYFDVAVGKGGSQLDMGFTLATIQPSTIAFQTGSSLTMGSRTVANPALDPEVVWHEIAHGLMARMNSEPFGMPKETHPFGRALVEGYATYFARAQAVEALAAEDGQAWARAAYSTTNFHARYDLDRPDWQPGADLLPLPNLYPPPPASDLDASSPDLISLLAMYDVGMIWARALWSLRKDLGAGVVDALALGAYFQMPGWLTSFETAAEAMLGRARASDLFVESQLRKVTQLCGARNILAGRGVQSLIAFGGEVWAGTDAGYYRSSDNGATFGPRRDINTPGEGVRAFASDGTHLYAATRAAIYRWDPASNAWAAHGNWPSQESPLCLAVANDTPYVGTGDGVWVHPNGTGKQWIPWTGRPAFREPVLDLALAAGNPACACVASLRTPQLRISPTNNFGQPENWNSGWQPAAVGLGSNPAFSSTAVVAGPTAAFVGTYADGIWQQQAPLSFGSLWTRVATPAQLCGGAVLSLHLNGNILYAATTAGLFRIDLNSGSGPVMEPLATAGATTIVTRVLSAGGNLLVGTANDGLLVRQANPQQWVSHAGIGTELG